MEQLAAKLSKTIILDGDAEAETSYTPTPTPTPTPRIRDVKSFDDQVESICAHLFRALKSKQLESTYRRGRGDYSIDAAAKMCY